MQRGKIKWFNQRKGFGFITGNNGIDYFCHISQFVDRWLIPENDCELEFETKEHPKGPCAVGIKVVEKKEN